VCSKYERHVDKANQQQSNARPCWIKEFRTIPSGTRARYARHSCQPDDMRHHQEEDDEANSHATSDTPEKCDCCPSPVQMNSKTVDIPEAYSSRTCARKYQNGESFGTTKPWMSCMYPRQSESDCLSGPSLYHVANKQIKASHGRSRVRVRSRRDTHGKNSHHHEP
jgi:hypothetical protein